MIVRPDGLDLRRSLRSALGNSDSAAVEGAATRQEHTIDAILQRLYDDDDERRREIVLLADEVGLGKTFVALGVAWSVLHQRSAAGLSAGPVLVVTPHAHALFRKWRREAEQFLQLVVPWDMRFDVKTVETPHDLARALRKRRRALVIARMSAFSGRLHGLDIARMAAIHSLLHMDDFRLSMSERLEMLSDWPSHATGENLDLRRSSVAWKEALNNDKVGFDDRHIRAAWRRLERTDPRLCSRMKGSWKRVRSGRSKHSSFWEDLREICRAGLGQTVPHGLPLVIVDEIHNWKNHPTSWRRFLHTLGLRMDRLLGLSATPFQLGPHELIRVLELRRCIGLSRERANFLDDCVRVLDADMQAAGAAGDSLRSAWAEVAECDLNDLKQAWPLNDEGAAPDGLPPRLKRAFVALMKVREAHVRLGSSLKPFLLRHRRDVSHRAWWVGCEADPDLRSIEPGARGSDLRWSPGLDVSGDAELVHYLMMRAVQEQKDGRGATSLGADLGGSYEFFRESELGRMLPGRNEEADRYLGLVRRAVNGGSHEHPKIAITAERAFRAWSKGDKTLVFCFNIETVKAVQAAVNSRIDAYSNEALTIAFKCADSEVKMRTENFQKRLYNYRQSVFLLFQDHPFAGPKGRVPRRLALRRRDVAGVAARLALGGPPRDRNRRFDRRRILAATEQVLVARWKESAEGRKWLERVFEPLRLAETTSEPSELVLAPNWPSRRREIVEGVLREAEIEALPDDEGIDLHRECRHVIHHDLPWNPATLEQRTGRVDRIGSKTERLLGNGNRDCSLDVAVPYIAGTYDEHRFRVVHGRAHIFEVTMGGKYIVDGHKTVPDAMESESLSDDLGKRGVVWAPIPETIAADLRLHFEAQSPDLTDF